MEHLACPICMGPAVPMLSFTECMHKVCRAHGERLGWSAAKPAVKVTCPQCRAVGLLRFDHAVTQAVEALLLLGSTPSTTGWPSTPDPAEAAPSAASARSASAASAASARSASTTSAASARSGSARSASAASTAEVDLVTLVAPRQRSDGVTRQGAPARRVPPTIPREPSSSRASGVQTRQPAAAAPQSLTQSFSSMSSIPRVHHGGLAQARLHLAAAQRQLQLLIGLWQQHLRLVTVECDVVPVLELKRTRGLAYLETHPQCRGKWCKWGARCRSGVACTFLHRVNE